MSDRETGDSGLFTALLDDRIGRRRPITRQVEFSVRHGRLGVGENIGSELMDIAEEGVGIRLKENVQVGQELTIELLLPGAYRPLRLVGEVRWCQADEDGTYRVGVWLQRRLPNLTVSTLTS